MERRCGPHRLLLPLPPAAYSLRLVTLPAAVFSAAPALSTTPAAAATPASAATPAAAAAPAAAPTTPGASHGAVAFPVRTIPRDCGGASPHGGQGARLNDAEPPATRTRGQRRGEGRDAHKRGRPA